MAEITFYFKDKVIVAMSHSSVHGGFTFCEGSLFKDRCPLLMGSGFTAAKLTHCNNQTALTKCVKGLEKRLITNLHPSLLEKKTVTDNLYSEEYKQFREKYGK